MSAVICGTFKYSYQFNNDIWIDFNSLFRFQLSNKLSRKNYKLKKNLYAYTIYKPSQDRW